MSSIWTKCSVGGWCWLQWNKNTFSLLFFQFRNNEVAQVFVSLFNVLIRNDHMKISFGFAWKTIWWNWSFSQILWIIDYIIATDFVRFGNVQASRAIIKHLKLVGQNAVFHTIFNLTMCSVQAFLQTFWRFSFSFDQSAFQFFNGWWHHKH